MPELAHHRRAPVLAALAGMTALGFVMCTSIKPDEDEALIGLNPGPDAVPGGNDAGQLGAARLALGTPGCATADECSSGVCLRDVGGTLRCCERDCHLDGGRVCSTAGACVCSAQHREVGGLCLLDNGQPCREGKDCASDQCADGVCCAAACDGICERCDALPQVGTCVLYDRDPACVDLTNFACVARNRCRLPSTAPPLACRADADCDSDHCEPALTGQSVCCATECSGVCARCAATGVCGFPPSDPACPVVTSCPQQPTTCLDYRIPEASACSGTGQCAECEPRPTRASIPCGIGAQCDGMGACKVTALGRVAAGTHHTCAILEDAQAAGASVDGVTESSGNVRCWGDNALGQLGAAFDRPFVGDDETPASLHSELEINFGRTVVQITAGFAHTCVLFEEDGQVRCWGRRPDDVVSGKVVNLLGTAEIKLNSFGFVDPLTTGDVKLSEPAVQISAANGGDHTCAVLVSGKVSCWGLNDVGQCGIGAASPSVGGISNEDLPVVVLDPNNPNLRALQVSAGDQHTCALLSEAGRVTCWGAGYSGQLGYGEDRNRLAPQGSVAIGEPATQITAGFGHTCALLDRGRVRCWGSNSFGTLGYGHATSIGDDETPAQALTIPRAPGSSAFLGGDALIGGGNVAQITSVADSQSVCARFTGGEVRCWGRNDQGQLGYGHTENLGDRFRPDTLRQIDGRPAGGDVSLGVNGFAVALADGGRCAFVRPDGALGSAPLVLYCWGNNTRAQLGLPLFFPAGSASNTPVEMGPVNWDQNNGTTPIDAGVSSSPTRALPAP